MTQILEIFKKAGLTNDSNHFIPEHIEIELKHWVLWNDIIKALYFWKDDVAVIYNQITSFEKLTQRSGRSSMTTIAESGRIGQQGKMPCFPLSFTKNHYQ